MKEWIKKAKSAYEIYMMTNKPYGLTYLKYAEPYLSKEDFSNILGDAWVRSENPNGDANVSKKELLLMFKQADKKALMTEEDYKRWENLDDTLTVYRGVTSHNAKNAVNGNPPTLAFSEIALDSSVYAGDRYRPQYHASIWNFP